MYDFFISVSMGLWMSLAAICCSWVTSSIQHHLHVEELHFLRVVLDEVPARLDRVPHEYGEQLVGLDRVLDRDALEYARVNVHCRRAELVGVHLAQAFVALDVAPFPEVSHELREFLVAEHVLLGLALLDLVERRLSDVDVPPINHWLHVSEEEGQEQGAYVSAVHIGIGHDAHPVVPGLVHVELGFYARAEGGYHGAYLHVLEHLVEPGPLDVQYLAPQREHCLEGSVSGLLRAASCGVPLDQEKLASCGLLLRAVRQLPREVADVQQD